MKSRPPLAKYKEIKASLKPVSSKTMGLLQPTSEIRKQVQRGPEAFSKRPSQQEMSDPEGLPLTLAIQAKED